MCMFGQAKAADPVMPPEYAAMKSPNEKDANGAGKRLRDRLRSRPSTLLAGALGSGATDTTGKKVLLGQ